MGHSFILKLQLCQHITLHAHGPILSRVSAANLISICFAGITRPCAKTLLGGYKENMTFIMAGKNKAIEQEKK